MTLTPGPGNTEVIRELSIQGSITESNIRQAWFEIGRKLVNDARRFIRTGPKTGRLYRIKGRKRLHRASRVGESPANLTGTLARSINFKIRGWRTMEFGAATPYARRLESDEPDGLDRPYLIRAIDANDDLVTEAFERRMLSR